ncbi:MAG: DNA replication protein RecF [Epulopiscium sp. Nuni2H_MBin001]|nr:MAG: DNA replication protein RecF [Epulopiscium sp. Nuni2H_MBin001]
MYVKKLNLTDYRNYNIAECFLCEGINILCGDNAQGKTNILESIYICATARSHRTSHEKETIMWDKEIAHIKIEVQKKNQCDQLDFFIGKKAKSVLVNRLPINKLSNLFGVLNVVIFSPEDLQLVKKSPKERRRFIDIEICQFDKLYYRVLNQYYKVLKHRNSYLKQRNIDEKLLDILDMQLVEWGTAIIKKRKNFIEKISIIAKEIHYEISGQKENLEIVYANNINEQDFLTKLTQVRAQDIKTLTTSIGPHKDDMQFIINNMNVKTFGSQGQQRTTVLSTKLAEVNMLRENTTETPILLLDDVLSELDLNRQKYLFNYTKNIQTIITCTEIEQSVWNCQKIGKLYNIVQGNIICKST